MQWERFPRLPSLPGHLVLSLPPAVCLRGEGEAPARDPCTRRGKGQSFLFPHPSREQILSDGSGQTTLAPAWAWASHQFSPQALLTLGTQTWSWETQVPVQAVICVQGCDLILWGLSFPICKMNGLDPDASWDFSTNKSWELQSQAKISACFQSGEN